VSGGRRISEAELNAFVDGELAGTEAAEVQAALANAPEDLARVRAISALNEHLAQHYAKVLAEPVPAHLAAVAARIPHARRWPGARRLGALAGLAALLVAAAALGYLTRDLLDRWQPPTFVANALSAHSVFVPEVRHPVEVGAGEERHLVQWLTRRLGVDVRAPELSGQGWKLVGGRLLPDRGQPAAQFMYQDGNGRRLTLYVRKETGRTEAAFRFAEHGEFGAFYWIDHSLAYALAGRLEREELMRLATSIYNQLATPEPGQG